MPTHEAAGREPDRQEGGHRWWAPGWITPPAERDGGYDLGAPPLPAAGRTRTNTRVRPAATAAVSVIERSRTGS